ncbi:urease accessory protein UreF [Mangrovicoccus algicola]|uniref:Urease accessory protein UreF n=1 Tax=Mangrovicoccus algicola TaxID=2771008 RepID=A0A8J6Z9R4_9RHOB|nr:urease accessory UreF family protein [Mangrovicoccus algicola]MBE3638636.1 urease accessory protein UreF [Mangrovicoccus algicola]
MASPVTDDPQDLLTLVQWLSPSFPLGSFAFSHGLEHAISSGVIRDGAALADWLGDLVSHGSGRCDAVLLARVLAGGDPAAADALARALAAAPERSRESLVQGRAFLATTNAILGTDWPEMVLPVAVGLQARRLSLAPETVIGLYLQGFAANLVLGAVRLIPLGQTEGQKVIARLAPAIAALAAELARDPGDGALWSATPLADLAAMAHEHQEVRLFRS